MILIELLKYNTLYYIDIYNLLKQL